MFTGFGSFHRHRTVPMVGSSNDHGIDIVCRQQFFIGSVTCRTFTELAVRTFPVNIRSRQCSRFAVHIEDIAYAGHFDIQVVLLQELLVTFIFTIIFSPFDQSVDPGRFGKTCRTHQLFTADTETDHPDTYLFPIRLGGNHTMFLIETESATQALRFLIVFLFPVDAITQSSQHRDGCQCFQGIATAFRFRPFIIFRSIVIVLCCHDITLI